MPIIGRSYGGDTFDGEPITDRTYIDDFLLKEGTLGKYEPRIQNESPSNFWDWDSAEGRLSLTFSYDEYTIHYKNSYPLCFYHNKRFVFGVRKEPSEVYIDYASEDQAWARLVAIDPQTEGVDTFRVVGEREDYPRMMTRGYIELSHTLVQTDIPNVYSLGNGYCVATTRILDLGGYSASTNNDCWWMVGPEEEREEISRRVLVVKIYDGPHPYQARGTDLRLSDPHPIQSPAEYVIYAYDNEGLKGFYKKSFDGTKAEKRAQTISEDNLLSYESIEGNLKIKDGQLTGRGTAYYKLPLKSTKLLNVYHRGSEVDIRIRPDGEDWVPFSEYDGKAVRSLEIEADIYNSLSAIRVEWESLRDWTPVGRPVIDVLPVQEEHQDGTVEERNKIRITGTQGEGLGQVLDLYTGIYTASADVRAVSGEAILDVGGYEVVSWNPLDKTIRGPGQFIANAGQYELIITGEPHEETFSLEVDKIRVAEGDKTEWLPEDIRFLVETEDGEIDATDSINNPEMPVSVGKSKRYRLGIKAPRKMDHEVYINALYADTIKTGEQHFSKRLYWRGSQKSRIHYPEEVLRRPTQANFIVSEGNGSVSFEQTTKTTRGDIEALVDGGRIFYRDRFIYRPITISNEFWKVEVEEDQTLVYYQDNLVGRMEGQALPFRIAHFNSEDIQLDCSVGLVQLRRGLGPRFEGWNITSATMPQAEDGATIAFGFDESEAQENLPHYTVSVGI